MAMLNYHEFFHDGISMISLSSGISWNIPWNHHISWWNHGEPPNFSGSQGVFFSQHRQVRSSNFATDESSKSRCEMDIFWTDETTEIEELDVSENVVYPEIGCVWKCCVPLHPMVLLIITPSKWLFCWGYTPFSDIPNLLGMFGMLAEIFFGVWTGKRRFFGYFGDCCQTLRSKHASFKPPGVPEQFDPYIFGNYSGGLQLYHTGTLSSGWPRHTPSMAVVIYPGNAKCWWSTTCWKWAYLVVRMWKLRYTVYHIYCISFLSIEYRSISMEISIFRYLFGIEYHHGMGVFPASRSQLAEAASPPGSRGRSADAAADGVPTAAGGLVDLNRSQDG